MVVDWDWNWIISSVIIAILAAAFTSSISSLIKWINRPKMDIKWEESDSGQGLLLRIYNNGNTVMNNTQIKIELGFELDEYNLIEKEFSINPKSYHDIFIGILTMTHDRDEKEYWILKSGDGNFIDYHPIRISASAERVSGKHTTIRMGDLFKKGSMVFEEGYEIK